MSDLDLGWAWFETDSASDIHETPNFDRDLANVYARCFSGESGLEVLRHLKSITHSRVLGPGASDALLRHVEGQRQLVAHIISLAEHGRSRGPADDQLPTRNGPKIMENTDD
jgi:hypothetical protein